MMIVMVEVSTMERFRESLIAYGKRLSGTLLSLTEVDAAIEEWRNIEGYEDGEEVPVRGQWSIFRAAAPDFTAAVGDDPLLMALLVQWNGPHAPEEQFLEQDEMVDAMEAYPEEFRALAETADAGYTLYDDPPEHAAIYSEQWGWVLARPDGVQRFRSPLDLLEYLAEHDGRVRL